jgi:hypothetical protein
VEAKATAEAAVAAAAAEQATAGKTAAAAEPATTREATPVLEVTAVLAQAEAKAGAKAAKPVADQGGQGGGWAGLKGLLSSRNRAESDKEAIRRLQAELKTATIHAQPAESTSLSPATSASATDPPHSPWPPAPHADMVNELRLLRSEMETARQSAPVEKSEREVTLLEQLRDMEQKLATSQHDLAEERHKLEKSHVDEDSLRRKVVEEMSQNWVGISKVVESALLGSTVHSEGAEKALKNAREEAGAAGGGNSRDDEAGSGAVASKNPEWSSADWMASQGVAKLIADTLFARAGGAHLPFLRALAKDMENGKDAITALLRVGLLEKLSDCIWDGAQKLVQNRAASGVALHEKFVSEGDTFKLNYGGLVRGRGNRASVSKVV